MSEHINIRIATADDAAAIRAIYAPYVTDTAIAFEYDVPSEDDFRERIRKTLQTHPYLVAEKDGVIIGYAYAGAYIWRPAYDYCAEATIYLERNQRRQGIGRALYEALEEALQLQGIITVYACIAYPEEEDEYVSKASVHFHSRMGYRLIGTFAKSGYKFNRWYDMVWMEKNIGEHRIPMPPVRSFPEIEKSFGQRLIRAVH